MTLRDDILAIEAEPEPEVVDAEVAPDLSTHEGVVAHLRTAETYATEAVRMAAVSLDLIRELLAHLDPSEPVCAHPDAARFMTRAGRQFVCPDCGESGPA